MHQVEIGRGKRALRAYSFDDIYLSPARRTRDADLVSTQWQIDAYTFDAPMMTAPADSVVSPETAVALGRLGVMAVLPLEGLWTRYEDPRPGLAEVARADGGPAALARLRALYETPVSPELVAERVIRGTTVSAEHVSQDDQPLNLKEFVAELDVPVVVGGCATYQAALHLMRTGAAGVLVGFGGGSAHRTVNVLGIRVPMASAVADVAEARRDYLDESGGRYVHVIADGAVGSSGDLVKAIACGADAVMVGAALARAAEAPGGGYHWGSEAVHPTLPRGDRVELGTSGTFEEILFGPSDRADGTRNMVGALRKAMATTGYRDIKEFQRVQLNVRPG
jgi:IMP dehydrogenase